MRLLEIVINIPKEFEADFKKDSFQDCLERLKTDAHLMAGEYEIEFCNMLINAFRRANPNKKYVKFSELVAKFGG